MQGQRCVGAEGLRDGQLVAPGDEAGGQAEADGDVPQVQPGAKGRQQWGRRRTGSIHDAQKVGITAAAGQAVHTGRASIEAD